MTVGVIFWSWMQSVRKAVEATRLAPSEADVSPERLLSPA
jgi:hypothetical protein